MQLVNALNGYQFVLKTLKEKEGYCWKDILGINKDEHGSPRYYIAIGEKENIFIKFSREFYTSGKNGFRESINVEGGIKECFKDNVKRLFWVYPDGKIYWIKLNEPDNEDCFTIKAEKRVTNNENKEIFTILIKNLKRYNV